MTETDINPEPAPTEQPEKVSTWKNEFRSWLRAFGVALAFFVLLRVFVFDVNEVSGTSMQPAFQRGDKVLVDKVSTAFNIPERGEVIVFTKPGQKKRLIKRIIAGPGDTLEGMYGQILVNGEPLAEDYVATGNEAVFNSIGLRDGVLIVDGRWLEPVYDEGTVFAGENIPDNTIPDGMVFVLGDNRPVSLDSLSWGLVPASNIIGRVVLIFSIYPPQMGMP